MAKVLKFKWLTDGDDGCNKKVEITDEEFDSLKGLRGFPHEIDLQGGAGYPRGPSWINRDDESHPDPYDRPAAKGRPNATVLIY